MKWEKIVEGISWVQHLDGNQPSSITKWLLILRSPPQVCSSGRSYISRSIPWSVPIPSFVDNDTLVPCGEEGHDHLEKVGPVIDHLSTNFAEVLNEAMIKFHGRSSLEQYMPLKPTKWGIKVWVATYSTNGYFSQFEVYTGKKDNTIEQGLGARVVKTLTSDFKGKYHRIYFDNFSPACSS